MGQVALYSMPHPLCHGGCQSDQRASSARALWLEHRRCSSYATRAHKVVFLQLQKHSGLTFEFLIALPTLVVQLVVRTALSC